MFACPFSKYLVLVQGSFNCQLTNRVGPEDKHNQDNNKSNLCRTQSIQVSSAVIIRRFLESAVKEVSFRKLSLLSYYVYANLV